jgi:single-stranded-DNA-specific exonuclease
MTLKGSRHEWAYEPADPGLVDEISRVAGVQPVVARVLVSRGMASASDAKSFLDPALESLSEKRLLPDAGRVVDRMRAALSRRETVAVHGHDDADGVTASAIMLEALEMLGAKVVSYIPDRRREGHGLNRPELDRLSAEGVGLIVTVDCCVSDVRCIRYAAELGIDTIVTDHHEIPPELPPAVAIVNAKLPESDYPYRYLAGAGVSLRVADLLLDELSGGFGRATGGQVWCGPRWYDEALAIAAVGSITDKVPLTGDNRIIVSAGLKRLPATERPGLIAMLEESKLWGREIGPNEVHESIGPVFGRLSDGQGGNGALDLLLTADLKAAREQARALVGGRARWRESAGDAWRRVWAAFESDPECSAAPAAIIKTDIPIDVMGYVTSRLSAETGLPSVVIVRKNGESMAEARGPVGFHLVRAFDAMRDLFIGYGGHPRAAGFSIRSDNVPRFNERMLEYVESNPPVYRPKQVDAELALADATTEVARELDRLRPFGQGNGPAVLVSRETTREQVEDATSRGLRFRTPFNLGDGPTDVVYRLRHTDGIAFASILDTGVSGG